MTARVLVVDDSIVVRRLLTTLLSDLPDFDVAGEARNGEHALQRVGEVKPDVVVMDVEMPVMDGIEAMRKLREAHPSLPVVMFSTFTERGSRAAMDALLAGAAGYVAKKTDGQGLRGVVQAKLAPKLREVLGLAPVRSEPTSPPPGLAPIEGRLTPSRPTPIPAGSPRPRKRSGSFDVLAIGCSTGGPNALADVIPKLPGDLGVPVLVVQHMPPRFTRLLAERLDGLSKLSVREAEAGDEVVANTVYLAPGGYHMRVRRKAGRVVVTLDREAPVNSCRPAVDPLFWSIGEVWGGNVLAVILTGMGHDGLDGCRKLAELGAGIVSQDEDSSVVWGMPRAIAQAGLADDILPFDQVAGTIQRRLRARPPALARTA